MSYSIKHEIPVQDICKLERNQDSEYEVEGGGGVYLDKHKFILLALVKYFISQIFDLLSVFFKNLWYCIYYSNVLKP